MSKNVMKGYWDKQSKEKERLEKIKTKQKRILSEQPDKNDNGTVETDDSSK